MWLVTAVWSLIVLMWRLNCLRRLNFSKLRETHHMTKMDISSSTYPIEAPKF